MKEDDDDGEAAGKKSGGRLSTWGDRNSVVVVVFVQ